MRAWSRAAPVMPVGPPITSPAARALPLDREPRAIDRDRPEHRVLPALVLPVTPLEPREANGAELSRGVALGVGQKLPVAHVERQRLEPLEGLTRRVAEVEAERRRDERIAVGVAELRRAGVVNVVPDGEVHLAQLDVPLVAPPVRAAPPLAASGGGAARAPRPGRRSRAGACGRPPRDRGRGGRFSPAR